VRLRRSTALLLSAAGCASDKDGENSEMARHLPDTDIIISTPFHPAYVTRDLISKASACRPVACSCLARPPPDTHMRHPHRQCRAMLLSRGSLLR